MTLLSCWPNTRVEDAVQKRCCGLLLAAMQAASCYNMQQYSNRAPRMSPVFSEYATHVVMQQQLR
jgi:hypothetical protein